MTSSYIKDQYTIDEIEAFAEQNIFAVHEAAVILGSKLSQNANLWPDPNDGAALSPDYYADVDLCAHSGGLLSKLSQSIASSIQFPRSSVFMHGIGVCAGLLCKNFYVQQYGSKKPVTIYAVTGQPPSTGKSGVNNYFCHPIMDAFDEKNKGNRKEFSRLQRKIDALEKDIIAKQKSGDELSVQQIEDEIFDLREEQKKYPQWKFFTDDATPEGLERDAGSQLGMINIISAEADAINIITGAVYGDKKTNYGMILKAWDGERHSSSRASRDSYSGYVRMCIAVLAQDESIDAILDAGKGGRGISERVFLLREKTLLGERDIDNWKPVDGNLYLKYKRFCEKIVKMDSRVVLEFSKSADSVVRAYKKKAEPDLADTGRYSNTMLRGFVGKAEKHIRHLAAVIHAVDEWSEGGRESTEIREQTAKEAVLIFEDIVQFYMKAADAMGYAGLNAEIDSVKQYLMRSADRGKLKVSIQQIRDAVKKTKAFSGVTHINERLRNDILPALESAYYCFESKGQVHINPRLR